MIPRSQPAVTSKAKLSGSNLRLLLLYDLLSRDAKRQRLSDYSVSYFNRVSEARKKFLGVLHFQIKSKIN